MLLNCPTCQATVEAGQLPPGATAACPYCQGLFQVPAQAAADLPVREPPVALQTPPAEEEKEAGPKQAPFGMGMILLFVVAIALLGGGSGYLVYYLIETRGTKSVSPSRPLDTETEDDRVAAWHTVGHWRGAGQQRTPPLRTSSPRLRIQWSATPRDPQNADNFAIHLIDGAGRQLATPVSIVGGGRDTAYVSARPGRYALEVFTFDTDWEVTVEEPQ